MSTTSPVTVGMDFIEALEVLRDVRGDEVLVTTMGAAREWPRIATNELDFHYIPAAMGHAPMIALGIAIAPPERHVIVLNGDGSLLMSLGCLVTITASGAQNLTMIVSDNGVYEVTGGQKTAAAGQPIDFLGFARAAGFRSVVAFDDLGHWRAGVQSALSAPGPRFILLKVGQTAGEDKSVPIPGPIAPRVEQLRATLTG